MLPTLGIKLHTCSTSSGVSAASSLFVQFQRRAASEIAGGMQVLQLKGELSVAGNYIMSNLRKPQAATNRLKTSHFRRSNTQNAEASCAVRRPSLWRNVLRGAVGGFVATGPMSFVMLACHRFLPWYERYPLPPQQIVDELSHRAGVFPYLTEPERKGGAVVSHFLYGAAAGAIYGLVSHLPGFQKPIAGVAYGCSVWTASYLGWLPAIRILKPATEHPARRNLLMIGAHVVWGAVLNRIVCGRSESCNDK